MRKANPEGVNEMNNKKKILVVDDEEDILETIKFRLEQEKFEVLTASDGYQALGSVRAHEPDLVILDVMIPNENGYRVCKFIKEDIKNGLYSKNIPVLLLTARKLDDDRERETTFMNFSHADLMIYKPFDIDDLIDKIRRLLN